MGAEPAVWQLARAKNRRKVTIDFALVGVNDSEGRFLQEARCGIGTLL
jgi:hypothetical protein